MDYIKTPERKNWAATSSTSKEAQHSTAYRYQPIAAAEEDAPKLPTYTQLSQSHKKKLSLAALVVLIYYEVSGGPFGIEDVVRAGGPFYGIVGFSLLLVWAVPEALITAELSTAMPESSGAVAWVDCAFGEFWAFQKGWLSWLSGVTDNALYPILFMDCLAQLLENGHDSEPSMLDSEGGDPIMRWAIIVLTTAMLTYLNYRGLDLVGKFSMVLCVLTLLPFLVFCLCGVPHVDPQRWLIVPAGGFWAVDWQLLLNTFFWNINYWESAAVFAADVQDPGRNYPIALALAVLMVVASLMFPILIATGASTQPYNDWHDGYFIQLAEDIVGPWLSYWLMFAAAIANMGMFEAEMSSDAWQLAGMADRGLVPAVLGTRSQHDTPVYAILLSALGVLGLGAMTFTEVIGMLNLLFCYGQLIEFAAFLWLRLTQPDLPRPYRIPLQLPALSVMLLGPVAFIFIIMYFSSAKALLVSISLATLGFLTYFLLFVARKNKWCKFETRVEDPMVLSQVQGQVQGQEQVGSVELGKSNAATQASAAAASR